MAKDIFPLSGVVGQVKITKRSKGIEEVIHFEDNLVVNGARTVLRDTLLSFDDRIIKMIFGDNSLSDSDDLVRIPPPKVTDSKLVNKVFEKNVTAKKVIIDKFPAVQYTCIVFKNEMNGKGQQIVTEFGLANSKNVLFSRKTRSAIFKDNESEIQFDWVIIFK